MSDVEIPSETLAILEIIAQAIRGELGEAIEVSLDPGPSARADPIPRVFRAIARALLEHACGAIPGEMLSQALRPVTEWRLALEGWDEQRIRRLMAREPGDPDVWLTFLLLSAPRQIEPLLRRDGAG